MEELWTNVTLKKFFETIGEETVGIDGCTQCAERSLEVVADSVNLGKATMDVRIQATKLNPGGTEVSLVLYEREHEADAPYALHFNIPDGGGLDVTLLPRTGTSFSDLDKENLKIFFHEIYLKYSRTMTYNMLHRVVGTDLDTGCANMESLMRHAGMLMHTGRVEAFAVLFFNIHNFKYVNKVFTYSEGDVVLRKYARMLLGMLQQDEVLARLGGDNFVFLVKRERVEEMIQTLQNVRISHTAAGKTKEFLFGATIGYSYLEGMEAPRDIMARSSIAYQAARARGAGSAAEYSNQIRQMIMERQTVLSNFAPALEKGEFVVYYQPKVEIESRTVCGAEALVRWFRNGEMIPPMKFIPVLEQEDGICKLDYYVLDRVCDFQRRRQDSGLEPVCISVNFSRRHLEEENLVEKIVEVIDRHGIDHKYIEIEVTESVDLQDYERITGLVSGLKNNGIGTSMDDFGTGFSSLNMIKKVDLSVIKLDRSFIPVEGDYPGKEKDMIMFHTLVALIKALGKKTVAEGAETVTQLQYLQEAGCGIVQGFVFDKPLPEEVFVERLASGYRDVELKDHV